eukprot:181415_1
MAILLSKNLIYKRLSHVSCLAPLALGICGYSFGMYFQRLSGSNLLSQNISKSDTKKNELKYLEKACHEMNKREMVLYRAFCWKFWDYVVYYGSTICTAGIGLLFTPLWKFYFFSRNCQQIRIGKFRCRVGCDFATFFFEVFVSTIAINICTVGMYSLFGYATKAENTFYDKHIEWYYDIPDAENE